MKLQKIICVILSVLFIATLFMSCGKKKENSIEIETVTDQNGEVITDAAGEAVTEVFEKVAVTDAQGEQITTTDGEIVTQRIPKKEKDNSNSALKPSSHNTDKSHEANAPKPSSKPAEEHITQKPKPTPKPQPKPTEPATTKPKPQSKPTEPATEKPKPPEKVYTAQYFVNYAIQYGKSIGLEYRTDLNKNNASWDTPMVIKTSVTENQLTQFGENYVEKYKEDIRISLDDIKREGAINHEARFWVQLEERDDGKKCDLYIGY